MVKNNYPRVYEQNNPGAVTEAICQLIIHHIQMSGDTCSSPPELDEDMRTDKMERGRYEVQTRRSTRTDGEMDFLWPQPPRWDALHVCLNNDGAKYCWAIKPQIKHLSLSSVDVKREKKHPSDTKHVQRVYESVCERLTRWVFGFQILEFKLKPKNEP